MTRLRSRGKASRRRVRGSALVEFAMAFILLVPLFYGTLKFGLALFYYNELASAVRAGARYASYRTYDSPSSVPSSRYLDAVRNMTMCGDPYHCDKGVVPGLQMDNVAVSVTMVGGAPAYVTVSITNFRLDVVITRVRLQRPAAVFPYMGIFAPAT